MHLISSNYLFNDLLTIQARLEKFRKKRTASTYATQIPSLPPYPAPFEYQRKQEWPRAQH